MASNRSDFQCKLYVGDLAKETTEKDLERAFSYYGGLRSVWVARNPAGFGFVVYEDKRDAEDAIDGLNGTTICGAKVRVEHASERPRNRFRGGGGGGGGRGGFRGRGRGSFNRDFKCYQCGEPGHFANDCPNSSGSRRGGGGGYSNRPSRFSRSRSNSPDYKRKSRSDSRSPPRKEYD